MANQVQVLDRSDLGKLSVIFGKQNSLYWEWYDTQDVANGNALTALNFFSNTRGGQGIAITNMEQPNQFISGKSFVLEEIALDINPNAGYVAGTLADFQTLTGQKSSFTFKINQVEYAQGLVKDLVGGGFFGFGTPATNVAYMAPRNVACYKLKTPVVIPTQTSFTLEFDYAAAPNPAATVTLRPRLIGTLVRLTSA